MTLKNTTTHQYSPIISNFEIFVQIRIQIKSHTFHLVAISLRPLEVQT